MAMPSSGASTIPCCAAIHVPMEPAAITICALWERQFLTDFTTADETFVTALLSGPYNEASFVTSRTPPAMRLY